MPEMIATAMGQSNPSYKASMELIAASGGNTAGFLPEHAGRKGVFQENAEDDEENTSCKGGETH